MPRHIIGTTRKSQVQSQRLSIDQEAGRISSRSMITLTAIPPIRMHMLEFGEPETTKLSPRDNWHSATIHLMPILHTMSHMWEQRDNRTSNSYRRESLHWETTHSMQKQFIMPTTRDRGRNQDRQFCRVQASQSFHLEHSKEIPLMVQPIRQFEELDLSLIAPKRLL